MSLISVTDTKWSPPSSSDEVFPLFVQTLLDRWIHEDSCDKAILKYINNNTELWFKSWASLIFYLCCLQALKLFILKWTIFLQIKFFISYTYF